MTGIDVAKCAKLVRLIADEVGTRGPQIDQNAAIGDLIAHVRAVSEEAEARMRSALADLYSAIGWTHEEGRPSEADYWLYDPIDGAYHWLQRLPLWSSSLVLVRDGEPVVSIIYDPSLREIFVASQGGGATCNGVPINVSLKSEMAAAVVGTAIPPIGQVGAIEQAEAFELIASVAGSAFVVRPMAAASLQLAYVAAGRLDAYFENGRDAADWLAGALLVREAGGAVTDLSGDPFGWGGDSVVAGNTALHGSVVAAIGKIRSTAPGTRRALD